MAPTLLLKMLRKSVLFSTIRIVGNKTPMQPVIFKECSSKSTKEIPGFPKNVIEEYTSASQQTVNGVIYDKKPFKFAVVKGKKYAWCCCGKSKSQPLCDGTHKNPHLKIPQRPVFFMLEEDKEVWLCNCKQTSKKPFCDGTHKREDIQAAVR